MKTISLIILCSALFNTGIMKAQVIELENDLVAHYPFDGDARNAVSNDNHGIETNVQYQSDRDGNPNSCCFLLGDSSYITISHTESLNFDARTESFSISFWVKSSDPLQGSDLNRRILSKWSEIFQTDPYPYSFQCSKDGLAIAVYQLNSPAVLCTTTDIWNDQWHHVAMMWSHEQQQLSFYVDNIFIESDSYTFSGTTSNTVDIYIGFRPITNVCFKGFIDDLFFYNRVINACEIETLYSGQLLEER